MGTYTWETVKALGEMPVKLVGARPRRARLRGAFRRRADERGGASRVAGEVALAHEVPVSDRFVSLLMLLGGINLFVACSTSSCCCRSTAGTSPARSTRRYGAASPSCSGALTRATSMAKLLSVAYVMAGVILVMSVVLIYADIVAPVRLG